MAKMTAHSPRRTNKAAKMARAMELRCQGHSYRSIAQQLGCDLRSAHNYVVEAHRLLYDRSADWAERARLDAQAEADRIDELIQAHWVAAGDPNSPNHLGSTAAVVKLVDMRAKLLGTYAPTRTVSKSVSVQATMTVKQAERELERLGLLKLPLPQTANVATDLEINGQVVGDDDDGGDGE